VTSKTNIEILSGMHNPITQTEAEAFARSWTAAWNSHDATRIAEHYHDDVEYYSPFVARITGGDAMRGRTAVEKYAAAALARYPELRFGPEMTVAAGAGSVALVYRSVEDLLAVETLLVADTGLVTRAHCHYCPSAPSASSVVAPNETADV
jgi:ketosteroid isomerase-like protein